MGFDPGGGTNDSCLAAIANGEAGFYVNGTWTLDGIKTKNPDCTPSFFVLPVSDDMEQNRAMYAAGNPSASTTILKKRIRESLKWQKNSAKEIKSELSEAKRVVARYDRLKKMHRCRLDEYFYNKDKIVICEYLLTLKRGKA